MKIESNKPVLQDSGNSPNMDGGLTKEVDEMYQDISKEVGDNISKIREGQGVTMEEELELWKTGLIRYARSATPDEGRMTAICKCVDRIADQVVKGETQVGKQKLYYWKEMTIAFCFDMNSQRSIASERYASLKEAVTDNEEKSKLLIDIGNNCSILKEKESAIKAFEEAACLTEDLDRKLLCKQQVASLNIDAAKSAEYAGASVNRAVRSIKAAFAMMRKRDERNDGGEVLNAEGTHTAKFAYAAGLFLDVYRPGGDAFEAFCIARDKAETENENDVLRALINVRLGACYLNDGEFGKAEKCLFGPEMEVILTLDPDSIDDFRFNRALFFMGTDRPGDALKELRACRNRKDVYWHVMMADNLAKCGNTSAAADHRQAALLLGRGGIKKEIKNLLDKAKEGEFEGLTDDAIIREKLDSVMLQAYREMTPDGKPRLDSSRLEGYQDMASGDSDRVQLDRNLDDLV